MFGESARPWSGWALVLFLVATCILVSTLAYVTYLDLGHLRRTPKSDITWAATQLETGLQRFRAALSQPPSATPGSASIPGTCRSLADLNGIGFEFESEAGKGTLVTLRIPAAPTAFQ